MPARLSATPSPVPPSPADLAAAANRTIPDVLPPPGVPLRVLFCGINPSLYSAATGWHFARPGNRFWPALHLSGFTPRRLAPAEQDLLAGYGLGITNLVARATAQAAELDPAELRAGGERLAALIADRRPRVLAVAGVTAYRTAFGRPRPATGLQRGGNVLGKITALRPLGRQFHGHLRAGHDTCMLHSGRVHRERPPAVAPLKRHPHPAAVDCATHVMHGLHAPLRIRVEGHHDERVASGISCDPDIKPLNKRGSS